MGVVSLTYGIESRLLHGQVGPHKIACYAVGSGGRAGSSKHKADPQLANNPFATYVSSKGAQAGGPLPGGKYRMESHPETRKKRKLRCIWLEPDSGFWMGPRDGMLIHGAGPEGSFGCIILQANWMGWLWNCVFASGGGELFVDAGASIRHAEREVSDVA